MYILCPPRGTGRTARRLHQLLVMLGRKPVIEEFNHLKTIDLAVHNDLAWKRVCQKLGWKFVPTV